VSDHATDILRHIYATLDKPVEEISAKAKVTCSKGCSLLQVAGSCDVR
jgi:hypothetical protein